MSCVDRNGRGITTGTTFGNMDFVATTIISRSNVTAGMVYSFGYSGGVWGVADRNGEAGENLARLTLYNSAGCRWVRTSTMKAA